MSMCPECHEKTNVELARFEICGECDALWMDRKSHNLCPFCGISEWDRAGCTFMLVALFICVAGGCGS